MKQTQHNQATTHSVQERAKQHAQIIYNKQVPPLTNYTLSTVCPSCGDQTVKLACKVCCSRCGFMWDCSEL